MLIAIRADGGTEIGMGHIMRTLVLADELKKSHTVFYVCKTAVDEISDKYESGIELVKSLGYSVILVREKQLVEDLKAVKADILITDSYDVNINYFNEINKIFPKNVYIDDLDLFDFDLDFVINQNINAIDLNYKQNGKTKFLLGTDYALLREEFRSIPNKEILKNANDILVTIGGADSNQITLTILPWLKEINSNFHIVVGGAFVNKEKITSYQSEKINIYLNANMSELMKKCDIAISACGSTVYELCACGVPTLGIIVADNQIGLANKMSDLGIMKLLGHYNKISSYQFIDTLKYVIEDYSWRKKVSVASQNLIDGKGAERIRKEFDVLK